MFRIACTSSFASLILLFASPAPAADAYPQKPVRIIVPYAPGGGTDVVARTVSDKLEEALGATVVIENRGSAGGTLGTAMVAHAVPDGYTLLFTSASFSFAPSIYKNLTYDAIKDFKPITIFASSPNILVVHPTLPVKNLKDFIALARKHPGKIDYGSAGPGSNLHLTTELFTHMAKIKLTQVPYKGAGPAQIGVMSGEVQAMMPGLQSSLPFIKSGQMHALAISTKQRAPILPDLPTIDESGVPGYDKAGWFALFAPAGVPDAIVAQLYQAAAKVLKSPDIAKRLAAQGAIAVANPPEEFTRYVHSEIQQWAKLIHDMKL